MNKLSWAFFIFFIATYGYSQQGWQPYDHDWSKREMVALYYTGTPYVEEDFV